MRQDRNKKLALVFMLALVSTPAPHAAAQPTAPAQTETLSPLQRQQADDFFRSGSRLYTQQKWADAETAFRAAWALNPTYDVAANLGHTEYQLGKYRDAAEHLSFALRNWPIVGKREPRELVQKRLAEARKQVGAVTIRVSRPGAEVFVDGKAVGRAPLEQEVFVEPGARSIEAKLAGYEDDQQRIEASKGGELSVMLTLAASAPGLATGPAETATVTPSGEALPGLPPPPPVATGPRKAVLIAGGATAGAALIAGVVFTVLANERASAAEEKNSQLVKAVGPGTCAEPTGACGEVAKLVHDRVVFSDLSFWSFVGAGTLGAATVIYGFATRSASQSAVRVAPIVTASGGGFAVGGAW
jgi:hypothetical protein